MPDQSIKERIVLHVVGLLEGAGKPAGLLVHRAPWRPLERDTLPAQAVFCSDPPDAAELQNTRTDHDDPSVVESVLNLFVEHRVTGESPDPLLDPLHLWAVRRLCVDPTLGGLVEDVEWVRSLGHRWADLDVPAAAVMDQFKITWFGHEDDPAIAQGAGSY